MSRWILGAVILFTLTGCHFKSFPSDRKQQPVVQVAPGADEIVVQAYYDAPIKPAAKAPQIVWFKPDQPTKVLRIVPEGTAATRPIDAKVLRRAREYYSPDTNRVWLTDRDHVIAIFDYDAATATFPPPPPPASRPARPSTRGAK